MCKAPIKDRRRLWKLIAAVTAFREAEEGVSYIATQLGNGTGKDDLMNCLWTGVIATYTRPYTHNYKVGPLSPKLLPEGKKRRTHDALVSMRNRFCGHSDHEAQLDSGSPLLPMGLEVIDGELHAHCRGARPDVISTPDVLELIMYMNKKCSDEWPRLFRKICPHTSLPAGFLVVNLSEENDDIFVLKN